jgi:hypothetical protein
MKVFVKMYFIFKIKLFISGPLCSSCLYDYYYDSTMVACKRCSDVGLSVVGIFVIFILVLSAVLVTFIQLARFLLHPQKHPLLLQDKSLPAIFLIFCVTAYSYFLLDDAEKRKERESRATSFYTKWNSGLSSKYRGRTSLLLKRNLQPMLKINIGFLQIITSLPSVLEISYPSIFSGITGIFSWFNVNLKNIGVECYFHGDYVDYLIVTTVIPFLFVAFLFVSYKCQQIYQTYTFNSTPTLHVSYVKVALLVSYFILPGICTLIFRTFTCINLDPDNVVSGDDVYMRADYRF